MGLPAPLAFARRKCHEPVARAVHHPPSPARGRGAADRGPAVRSSRGHQARRQTGGHRGLGRNHPSGVTASAAVVLLRSFTDGDAALRLLDPGQVPTLWPEHFDIGITMTEINYGVSPGDAVIGEPYAYVGPWQVPAGAFWNQPFGAARPLGQLTSPQAILEFFLEGRRIAAR